MTVKVFGIPNCGSVKKARTWLEENNIDVDFHDFKKLGIDEEHLNKWCNTLGWEKVINKRGLTWRGLDEKVKETISDQQTAVKLMLTHTSVIKRPVIETSKAIIIGYDEAELEKMFS
jgi:Spx/MgsR family transcriptional regulator